jgi:hypothetical protein
MLSGTLLTTVAAPRSADAQVFRRSTLPRSQDWDRDGIRDSRDRDDDNDGILDSRDRNDRSTTRSTTRYSSGRYYHNGRYYTNRYYKNGRYYYNNGRRDADRDGVRNSSDRDIDGDGRRNRSDRDKDGDGVRNRRDDRPKNPRRR